VHLQHRRKVAAEREQQYGKPCVRCGLPMLKGQVIQLDHTDDRTGYLGWSHQRCNVAASNRRRAELRRAQGFVPRRRDASRRQAEAEPGVWLVGPSERAVRQHLRRW
jgi:hypothetical protein